MVYQYEEEQSVVLRYIRCPIKRLLHKAATNAETGLGSALGKRDKRHEFPAKSSDAI